jgi:hypothetical protein
VSEHPQTTLPKGTSVSHQRYTIEIQLSDGSWVDWFRSSPKVIVSAEVAGQVACFAVKHKFAVDARVKYHTTNHQPSNPKTATAVAGG